MNICLIAAFTDHRLLLPFYETIYFILIFFFLLLSFFFNIRVCNQVSAYYAEHFDLINVNHRFQNYKIHYYIVAICEPKTFDSSKKIK